MSEKRIKVAITLAQDLIKIIRLLAISGKKAFTEYLYDPLYKAGWRVSNHQQNIRKLMARIEEEAKEPSYLQTIAPRCKRLIHYAMSENLSAVGDGAIFFLEKMQLHVIVSTSPESLEFTNIIEEPLVEFQKIAGEKSEDVFRATVSGIDIGSLKEALTPVTLSSDAEKIRFDEEIKRLYDNILIASKYNNIPKCRKLLANYIIRYSDGEDYSKDNVTRLITALNKREGTFEEELRDMIAIELYYRITRGILNGDIGAAIKGIRKYAYIFEGNPESKHFYDIDRLERILYGLITEKKLWDELKANR